MPYKRVHLKVGIFSAIALMLLVVGVGLLASGAFFRLEEDYVLYFEGSVSGLNVGAPVVFRGVPLGKVLSISLVARKDDESVLIPVGIDIFEENIRHIGEWDQVTEEARDTLIHRMVERGLRARIAVASFLTGHARIELDFFPETPVRYHAMDHRNEIPTLSSPLEAFSRALSRIDIDKIAHSLVQALESFNALIGSEELKGMLVGLTGSVDDVSALLREMPALAESARNALQRIATAADLTSREVPRIGHDMHRALDSFHTVAERAETLFLNTGRLTSPDSATMRELRLAVHELAEAARAVRGLAKTLERNPESLLRGKSK